MDISSWGLFGIMEISAHGRYGTGTFRHKDILTHGRFGTCTFWHLAKQYRHVHVPKYPCSSAVTSPCRNIHGAKKYPCQNVLVPKYPCAEKSPWWNVRAEMSPAEMSGAEISLNLRPNIRKWLFCREQEGTKDFLLTTNYLLTCQDTVSKKSCYFR